MHALLNSEQLEEVFRSLSEVDHGDGSGVTSKRQPVHTLLAGAHLFKVDMVDRVGQLGLHHLSTYTPDFIAFAHAFRLPGSSTLATGGEVRTALLRAAERSLDSLKSGHSGAWLAATVYRRVINKLRLQPLEDVRIDFDDAYGVRTDDEEDAEAKRVAGELASGVSNSQLPPFVGVRIKPLNTHHARRGVRTLDILLSHLLKETGAELPETFVISLPQVTHALQVTALARILDTIERKAGLPDGAIGIELTVESWHALTVSDGALGIRQFVDAAGGRCRALHFAAHDYLASIGIPAIEQSLGHPACEHARRVLQTAVASSGIAICDGATRLVPTEPHKAAAYGALSPQQMAENRDGIIRAWRISFEDALASMNGGFYQGTDVHPAQIAARFAAVYTYFLKDIDASTAFLEKLLERSGQTGVVNDVLLDTATGQGLLNYFSRAVSCGAITVDEAIGSGLTMDELKIGSFRRILTERTRAGGSQSQAVNMRTSPYSHTIS